VRIHIQIGHALSYKNLHVSKRCYSCEDWQGVTQGSWLENEV
jgi:hypothetical protein